MALWLEHGSVRSRSRFKVQPMRALAGVIVALWFKHGSVRSRSGFKAQPMWALGGGQLVGVLELIGCKIKNHQTMT